MAGIVNRPRSLVTAVKVVPVSSAFATTSAPGRTAPEESVTVPDSDVVTCPYAREDISATHTSGVITRNSLCFITCSLNETTCKTYKRATRGRNKRLAVFGSEQPLCQIGR